MEKKIQSKITQTQVEFGINILLTKGEAKALEALAAYDIDDFLAFFYKNLGKSYLQPHEKDLVLLFKKIRETLPIEIKKIDIAVKAINTALKDF